MRQRVLVLGATGMLGHKLCEVLGAAPELDVHATVRRAPESVPAGVSVHPGIELTGGTATLGRLLESLAPDAIVNAVGAIKQKDLTAAMEETFFLNGTFPHLLPLIINPNSNPNPRGRVIHISTDCVFVGDRGGYVEADRPDATDLYGRSKAVGELDYGPHLTLRTSIVGFERQGHLGLLSWFFSHPRGSTVRGFTRAIYSGLPTVTLARTIRTLLADRSRLRGLYHVASEPIAKHDLLRRLNDAFDLGYDLVPDDSLRIDRSLDDTRFRTATGTARPSWDALVEDLRQDYARQGYDVIYQARRAVTSSA